MSEETTTMGIEMTPEEKTSLIFNRKLKEYEKDEAFVALADYGLRDALKANPEVLANDNATAYKMMVDNAKARMVVEQSKQEEKVDEPIVKPVETKAPLEVSAPIINNGGLVAKVDFAGMDIYDKDKMKDVDLDSTTAMFIEVTRPQEKNKYDIGE